tara:strand:+ start:536 stop:709 length:174 start_codon:yes stop_codon:yes gene_type:complete
MTTEQKHRQDFWVNRFTEHLHSDKSTKGNDARANQAKKYADACLVQYDITFQPAEEL